jgi:hypothetical protein
MAYFFEGQHLCSIIGNTNMWPQMGGFFLLSPTHKGACPLMLTPSHPPTHKIFSSQVHFLKSSLSLPLSTKVKLIVGKGFKIKQVKQNGCT